jgi:hypothetical protein
VPFFETFPKGLSNYNQSMLKVQFFINGIFVLNLENIVTKLMRNLASNKDFNPKNPYFGVKKTKIKLESKITIF